MRSDLAALFQVVLIDITLAGDNAVVVGLAVAGLPAAMRPRAVWAGIGAATAIRLALSAVAVRLLAVIGLTLAGGVLLLWVCWKMFRELRAHDATGLDGVAARKTTWQAIWQIMVADLSMSLDNVLAVAGAARDHLWVMACGLGLSVVLMAVAANLLARLLDRQRWIAWLGLAVVVYVAGQMIVTGWHEVAPHVRGLVRWV
jgi:YjbE family integral membrane protein